MLGFLRNWSQLTNVPTELHEQLEAEGLIFLAPKVGVVRHFSGHVPGVFSASGVSRYQGAFAFSAAFKRDRGMSPSSYRQARAAAS